MTDPIDLDAYRPHEVSKMQCTGCGHKWTAVHPVGTTKLECPNCHEMEGRQAMTDIVKGMVFAFNHANHLNDEDGMRAALIWLANNVSKEMAQAMLNEQDRQWAMPITRTHGQIAVAAIAAAIRAAAWEEGK